MLAARSTKFYLPEPAADAVARPHLLAPLGAAPSRKLTLVTAPAGFGKTTLVATWLRGLAAPSDPGAASTRVAWYALDPTDDDFATFIATLVAAIQHAAPEAPPDWVDLDRRPTTPSPERLAVELARGLADVQGRLIVALEDYHLITDPSIHQFLAQLLRLLPPSLHVVVMSRHDPPLGLARLRAHGDLTEVRASDLAFSRDEAATFLAEVVGAPLTDDEVDALWQQTEGWIVGLRLAGISLRNAEDHSRFLADFRRHGSRHIADYLVDEALGIQPADVEDFLLKTSILARLSGPLAAAVVGLDRHDGQAMLERLAERGLFLTSLDDHRGWYRYHPQFQTLLQRRLAASLGDAGVSDLHRRAAEWLARQGLLDEALGHYLVGGQVDAAARLVEQHAVQLENAEEMRRWARWLDALPAGIVAARPALLLSRARLLYQTWVLDPVPALVERAEALLRAAPDADAADAELLWGLCHALRSTSAFPLAPIEERMQHAREALQRLPRSYYRARGMALNWLGRYLAAQGNLDEARRLNEAEMAAIPSADLMPRVRLAFNLGALSFLRGTLDELDTAARTAVDVSRRANVPTVTAWSEWGLAEVHQERNEVEAAIALLEHSLARPELVPVQTLVLSAYSLLPLYTEQRRPDAIAQVLDVVRQAAALAPGGQLQLEVAALVAYGALLLGDRAAAAGWAATADREPPVDDEYRRGLIMARVLLALGAPEDLAAAEALLHDLRTQYSRFGHIRGQVRSLALLARVYQVQQRRSLALAALRQAIDLGYPRGYRRTFTEHGAPMGELLHELARERAYAEAAGVLLADLARVTRPTQVWEQRLSDGSTIIVEPLSQRELDILTLLAEGLSNKEIGQRLSISPLTVRNHTASIYAKLHVENRHQAVARAREIGILRVA